MARAHALNTPKCQVIVLRPSLIRETELSGTCGAEKRGDECDGRGQKKPDEGSEHAHAHMLRSSAGEQTPRQARAPTRSRITCSAQNGAKMTRRRSL